MESDMTTRGRTGQESGQQQGGGGTRTEARAGGPPSVTFDLPLVTAQFRAPHVPSREEIGSVALGVWSMLPSASSVLFYGGLAVTAAVGVIEWPVAAAIGVGTALASRGAANPQPDSGTPQTAPAGRSGSGNTNGNT